MSSRVVVCMLAASAGLAAGPALAGSIDAGLQEILASTPTGQEVSTLVFLKDQVDIRALSELLDRERATRQMRHEVVVRSLQEKAWATQAGLRDHLKQLERAGRVRKVEAFWISNAFRVDAPVAEIEQLANHPDVGAIYLNYPVELIGPVAAAPDRAGPRAVEIGVVAVRAPEAWALGYTGQGALVGTMDTGVDGNHPALASRWAGVADPRYADHPEWAWHDSLGSAPYFPTDTHGHGTHTMGTVCGGAPGDEVGVAPGALWIAANTINQSVTEEFISDVLIGFEWFSDPDGDPSTHWDVPAVCSNSWGLNEWWGYTPCDETFWSALDACEAAGCLILFSAGNEGSAGLRRPADRATDDYRTCAVAAVDANDPSWPIADFSARGPTDCTPDGSWATKPDIAAPGVDVRSSVPGGGYGYKDGTSMASPHFNGVVALISQACPELTVEKIKQIIFDTAYDLGDPGEDNAYGWGMVDAYEAVLMAEGMCGPSPPRAYDGYYEIPVDTPVLIELYATDYDGEPEPLVYIITSLPDQMLTDADDGHVVTAEDLPYTLVNHGNQVWYTPSGGYYGTDTFTFKANDGGVPPDGGDSEIATISVLVLYGPPVIVTDSLPNGCLDHPYGPVYLEAEGGQPELVWSVVSDEYVEVDLGESQFAAVGTAQGWHDDDQSWSYALPFAFPLFEQSYTSCWICSNGFVDFASADDDFSNSDAELIANKRIAPLWDDLRTDYGGDIYIDASVSGAVTIRWAAETYWGGYPVNFSATLSDDGTIQFHYGDGNTGLTPTVGISGGDGTHYLLSSYNGASSLTWADSLEFALPVPLPAGMEFSPEGVLSGTPTEAGTFEPRFMVTDSLGRSDVKQIPLTVDEQCAYPLGDLNCDFLVNAFDIDPFVLALDDPEGYAAAYPDCDIMLADINGDGAVDAFDIDPFVQLLIVP